MRKRLALLLVLGFFLLPGWACQNEVGGSVTTIHLDGSVGTPSCNPDCGVNSHNAGG